MAPPRAHEKKRDPEAVDEAARLVAEQRATDLLAAIRPNLVRLLLEREAPPAAMDCAVRWPNRTDGKSIITVHCFARWGGL